MIVTIVQARVDSNRLPAKVLMNVAPEKPMLGYVLDRLAYCREVNTIVVATTVNKEDNAIAEYCRNTGVAVFRGDSNDVLDRYYGAAVKHQADVIVRVTADCPLVDPGLVDELVREFKVGNYDHAGLHNFPDGLDAEVMSLEALFTAWREARKPSEREHVTPFIWSQPDRFYLHKIEPPYSIDISHYRWTVDEQIDLDLIRQMIADLDVNRGDSPFCLDEMLIWALKHDVLAHSNKKHGRNEGYRRSLEDEGREATATEVTALRLDDKGSGRYGFAGMSPEKRREIARKGGLATAASGRGRKLTDKDREKALEKRRK